MEIIHESPSESSFVPLSEHQSQTPQSFYSGPPVLHNYSPDARLVLDESEIVGSEALLRITGRAEQAGNTADETTQDRVGEVVVISGVDIWIVSSKFILYRPSISTGISVPYPNISLHAISHLTTLLPIDNTLGLYLQIDMLNGFDDHDPDNTISITLVPAPSSVSPGIPNRNVPVDETSLRHDLSSTTQSQVEALYSALSACANLHPDPSSDPLSLTEADIAEDVGDHPVFEYDRLPSNGSSNGLPPAMPGSNGWITAENMDQFFDEEGNWRISGLGPGAGIVRERSEEDRDDEVPDSDGLANGDGEETKWRRME